MGLWQACRDMNAKTGSIFGEEGKKTGPGVNLVK